MSICPENPDDTLQRLLSRKKAMKSAYNATDAAAKLDELESLLKQRAEARVKRNTSPVERPSKKYWFDAR